MLCFVCVLGQHWRWISPLLCNITVRLALNLPGALVTSSKGSALMFVSTMPKVWVFLPPISLTKRI